MSFCAIHLIEPSSFPEPSIDVISTEEMQVAILAGGCFWCIEAVFSKLEGVNSIVPGYSGDNKINANYKDVCSGNTKHAEVIKICFDSNIITFGHLLKIFFSVAHDPTQVNRQGNDIGLQYRSQIFYLDSEQEKVAKSYINQLNKAKVYDNDIVTKLDKLNEFYPAESYHHKYADINPDQPYIKFISLPKVEKLKYYFPKYLNK